MSQSLRDNEGNYIINGKKYASVTTIINKMVAKDQLKSWQDRTPTWPEISRKARINGILMHQAIQNRMALVPVEMPDVPYWEWPEDAREELEGRLEQFDNLGLLFEHPMIVEHTVVIHAALSAGTLDHFGPVDKYKTLMDYKSSSRPQKSHKLQMGAYFIGLMAEGKVAEHGIIAYVRKKSAELVEMTPEEMLEEGEEFLGLARKFYKTKGQST